MSTIDRIRQVVKESQLGINECADALVLLGLVEQQIKEQAAAGDFKARVMEAYNHG